MWIFSCAIRDTSGDQVFPVRNFMDTQADCKHCAHNSRYRFLMSGIAASSMRFDSCIGSICGTPENTRAFELHPISRLRE